MSLILRHKAIFITIVVLAALCTTGLLILQYSSPKVSRLPSCPKNKQVLTVSPMALDDIMGVVPLGNLNPPGHTLPVEHMYFLTKLISDPTEVGQPTTQVAAFAPGDIVITNISYLEYLNRGYSDYSISFSPCQGITASFIHLSTLAEPLQNIINSQKGNDSTCQNNNPGTEKIKQCWFDTELNLKAGEAIGTVGGKSGSFGLDFSLTDNNSPPGYVANPKRFRSDLSHNACGIDYFSADLSKQFYSKLGSEGGRKNANTTCNTAIQDVEGTAQGAWFKQGSPDTPQNENDSVALVHDNIDPTEAVFSISLPLESIGIPAGTYRFQPKSSGLINRDFNGIKPSNNTYCFATQNYGNPKGLLLVLVDETTLKIALNSTSDCSTVSPRGSFVTFHR